MAADYYYVDPETLDRFVREVTAAAFHHPVFRSMVTGFVAASAVMIQRAGRVVAGLPAEAERVRAEIEPAMPV